MCLLGSVGGYTALSTAAFHEKEVIGVALLNSAGRFKDQEPEAEGAEGAAADETASTSPVAWLVTRVQALVKRVGIYLAFQQAKQPARIKQVLDTVLASSLGSAMAGAQVGGSLLNWAEHILDT